MRKILITGGTGLVGTELTRQLTNKGYAVNILTRAPEKNVNSLVNEFHWDINNRKIDETCLQDVTDIIHLAGASVAQKWTDETKKIIINSRVNSANLLINTLKKEKKIIRSFIGASASGIYKPNTGEVIDENSELGTNFLSEVCTAWENASFQFASVAKNIVINRIGIVLSKDGGALEKMALPINLGISSYFGNGQQFYPCIHIEDVARQFIYTLENDLSGTFNCSVESITQKELNSAIAQAKGKKVINIPTPIFALKIALGEMHIILTDSINMTNKKILSSGFEPKFATVQAALNDIY